MRSHVLGALVGGALVFFSGAAFSGDEKAKPALSDQDFVRIVGTVNAAEIEMGKLASERSSNVDVKDYGRVLETDHTKAQVELRILAKMKGLDVPTVPDSEHMKTHERLSKLEGAAFDREFLKAMVAGHKKAIGDVSGYVKDGRDQELKDYATKILPDLQHHLDVATKLEKKIGT
jgi:putative membrane protein